MRSYIPATSSVICKKFETMCCCQQVLPSLTDFSQFQDIFNNLLDNNSRSEIIQSKIETLTMWQEGHSDKFKLINSPYPRVC